MVNRTVGMEQGLTKCDRIVRSSGMTYFKSMGPKNMTQEVLTYSVSILV